jgi:[protein-PII] uridylyltransferase
MYHVYTVDEHTLQAVGILHKIGTGALRDTLPFATEVMQKVVSRRALMAAMVLHDICKGRGGDHSVLGARVAERLGPRFGLTAEETETAAWLVRWHLALSSAAFKRDVDDETTVQDLVDLVQSPERLRQLLVLTAADIMAVGPGRWNAWKATLLQNLFANVEERLVGGFVDSQPAGPSRVARVRRAQEALRARLKDWPGEEIDAHLAQGYPAYWLAFDAGTHERQARLMRRARRDGSPLNLDTRVDRARAVTEITLYTPDHPGLFARLAGAFAVSGATIVDARIFTMADGMALDVFSVQDAAGGSFSSADRLAKLAVNVERTLSGELRPLQELARRKPSIPARTRVFRVPPRVLIDNAASSTHTVIEVNGKDRPGLLYDLTRSLTGLSLQIASALISTYGAQVIDVFYVRDLFGLKVTHKGQLARIRERLLEALADPEESAAAPPPRPVRTPRAPARGA